MKKVNNFKSQNYVESIKSKLNNSNLTKKEKDEISILLKKLNKKLSEKGNDKFQKINLMIQVMNLFLKKETTDLLKDLIQKLLNAIF
jgi:hypothetical protein